MQQAIIWHIGFWLFITLLNMANIFPYFGNVGQLMIHGTLFLPLSLIGTYFNWWVLMPTLLQKKRLGLYIITVILLILVLSMLQRYLCQYHFYPSFWVVKFEVLHTGLLLQAISILSLPILFSIWAFRSLTWYQKSNEAQLKVSQQKTEALNYLQAQINPHFLFNTLNSLYGLSLEQNKKVPNLILQLSDLLNYSLYRSQAASITLEEELDLIRNMIALEQVRFEDRVQVELTIDSKLDLQQSIAPLLLIPLVENAFKHGVKEAMDKAEISISINEMENGLCFEVKNSIASIRPENSPKTGGLGLENLKKRLEILYPNRHELKVGPEANHYFAQLKITTDVQN